MKSKVATAYSVSKDGFKAGSEAAKKAISELGGAPPKFLLVFATTGYDQQALLNGVREVSGGAPMSGCSAEGIITQGVTDESGHSVTVMAFATPRMEFFPLITDRVTDKPIEAADAIAAQMASLIRPGEDHMIWFLPDGTSGRSTDFLNRLDEKLPFSIPVVGGGSGGIFDTWQAFQYHGYQAHEKSASVVLVRGRFQVETGVAHGSTVLGLKHRVTEASDGYVRKIDGKAAIEMFREYMDIDKEGLKASDMNHLCIARAVPGEHRRSADELILAGPSGIDNKTGDIFFPAGIPAGTDVYVARRDPDLIKETVHTLAKQMVDRGPRKKPMFVLDFDCCSRGFVLFGKKSPEFTLAPLRKALGEDVPWQGMYSFGEIAPLKGKSYYHCFTVALCAVYERD